jgi:uncharacterized protein with GYD domain
MATHGVWDVTAIIEAMRNELAIKPKTAIPI